MPSLVDVHVHVNDPAPGPASGWTPGRQPAEWEGFPSASRAAAAGGITLLVDMPLNSEPVTTSLEALEAKLRVADGRTLVDVAFYAGVVPANARDRRLLSDLSLAGVAAFKCFLCDSGLATFPPVARAELRAAMDHLAQPRSAPPGARRAPRARVGRAESPDRAQLRRLPLEPPSAGRARRDCAAHRPCPGDRLRGPRRPSRGRRGVAAARARPRRGSGHHGRDLPALPDLRRRGDRRRRHGREVRTADSQRGESRGALGWPRARSDRFRRDRPLSLSTGAEAASTAAISLAPGVGSPRCSCFCRRSGAAPRARGFGLERLVEWTLGPAGAAGSDFRTAARSGRGARRSRGVSP